MDSVVRRRVILSAIATLLSATLAWLVLRHLYEIDELDAALASDSNCILLDIAGLLAEVRVRTGSYPTSDDFYGLVRDGRSRVQCGGRKLTSAGVVLDAFGDPIVYAKFDSDRAIVHLSKHHESWGDNHKSIVLGYALDRGMTEQVLVQIDPNGSIVSWKPTRMVDE